MCRGKAGHYPLRTAKPGRRWCGFADRKVHSQSDGLLLVCPQTDDTGSHPFLTSTPRLCIAWWLRQ